MTRNEIARTLIAGFIFTASLLGTLPEAKAQFAPPKFLKTKVAAPALITPGKPFTITVTLMIDKPFHVQSNPPKENYIPTEIKLGAMKGFKAGKATYPKPTEAMTGGEKLPVFEGKVDLKLEVTADASVKPGKYALPLTLSYQGCNDKVCYPPTSTAFKASVTVASAKKKG